MRGFRRFVLFSAIGLFVVVCAILFAPFIIAMTLKVLGIDIENSNI